MKAVILAGGKGTRLGLTDKPKPMVDVAGKPLLERQILLLKDYNITNIILLTGHLSEKIEEYFGDGSKWGVNISYIKEEVPLGTAGAVKQLEDILNERFLLLYGDIMLDFNINQFIAYDQETDSIGTIIVHPNDHPYDSDLVEINEQGFVTAFLSKPHPEGLLYNNNVNAAVYILSADIFTYIESNVSSDFGKDIFPRVIAAGKHRVRAYDTPEFIKDLGTPDRLAKITKAFKTGKTAAYNKTNKRAAIFIDRDGVINKEVDNLRRIGDFEMLPSVQDAIKEINESDFLAIVITNQPVIAKGFLTQDDLILIHKKLETQLGVYRVYLDKIYYCPHHPDKGFEGEIAELKINCDCRKPKIGMIKLAEKELNIDIEKSYIIGDSTTDIQTGINAGLTTVLVSTGHGGKDAKFDCTPDIVATDLYDGVKKVLGRANDYKQNSI